MANSAIYVVQICSDRSGVRVLARAATSASTGEFTSAEALWRFLLSAFPLQPTAAEREQATPEQRSTP